MKKFIEAQVCDQLKEILQREVRTLHSHRELSAAQCTALEKLTKVYAILKDDLREDVKADLWSKLNALADA